MTVGEYAGYAAITVVAVPLIGASIALAFVIGARITDRFLP